MCAIFRVIAGGLLKLRHILVPKYWLGSTNPFCMPSKLLLDARSLQLAYLSFSNSALPINVCFVSQQTTVLSIKAEIQAYASSSNL